MPIVLTFNLIHDGVIVAREKIIRDAYCELIRRALARADYTLARAIGARALRECAVEMRAVFGDENATRRMALASNRARKRRAIRREWHSVTQYVAAQKTALEAVPHYANSDYRDYDAHDAI